MIWEPDGDGFTLSTGREVYANCNIVGIGPMDSDAEGLSVSYGCDGGIATEDWSVAERRELADEMIRLWREWAVDGEGG